MLYYGHGADVYKRIVLVDYIPGVGYQISEDAFHPYRTANGFWGSGIL